MWAVLEKLFHWSVTFFQSPNRVQVLAAATEAAEFGKNAMAAVRALQLDNTKLWGELEALRRERSAEIMVLQEQERTRVERVAALTARVVELEDTLAKNNGAD